MAKVKLKMQEVMSRDDAAARLSEIAASLAQEHEFEIERGAEKLQLDVPEQVTVDLEVEVTDDSTELEIEIKWARVDTAPTATESGWPEQDPRLP
jgi:amphi-Trp domain-containing protein